MIENFIVFIFHAFKSLGTFGVFLSMLIENIGIPLPTEIGYVIGQQLINVGQASFYLITTFGHILGSLISYFVGLWGGNLTKKLIKIGKIAETRKKLVSWYKKYGDITVFIARFIGYVRPWSSLIAGFSEVEFWPFLLWTALGSLIFNIGILLFSQTVVLVWDKYASLHLTIILIAIAYFFGFILYELFLWARNKFSHKNS